MLPPASKPWWQQATALVSLGAGGAVTGLSFVPKASADVSSPASMPISLLALKHSVQHASSSDARLRSAIVNVASYYRQLAEEKSPAEMEALIWQHDSVDGADHGPSCAAFATLTLHLASQVVGQQSWVTGGSSYPWPLHDWADVRVDPNPDSPGVTSIVQDARAHGRWHPLGDGYRPQRGDWVLFDGHIEVVTGLGGGVLHTVGADSLPNYSVNAHQYPGPLAGQGVVGFVNNGTVPGQRPAAVTAAAAGHGSQGAGGTSQPGRAHRHTQAGGSADGPPADGPQPAGQADIPGSAAPAAAQPAGSAAGLADIPGTQVPGPRSGPPGPVPGHHAGQGRRDQHRAAAAGSGPARGRPEHRAGRGYAPAGPRRPRTVSVADAGPGTAAIPGLQFAAQRSKPAHPAVPAGPYRRHQPAPGTAQVSDSSAQQAFIDVVARGAVAAQRKYGVPAAVTIAQAIEESGWGQSALASQDNNLFGIKGSGPAGSDAQPTQEFLDGSWVNTTAGFAVYRNVAESINDHGRLLATSGYYTKAMTARHSPNAFAEALTGVYATDPGYGAKLIGLMRQYNLYRYDVAGRAAATATASQPAWPGGGGPQTAAAPGGASIPGLPGAPAGPVGSPAPRRTPARPARPAPSAPARPSPAPSSPGPATPAPSTPTPVPSTPTPVTSTPTPVSSTPTPVSRSPIPAGSTPAAGRFTPGPASPAPGSSAPASPPAGSPAQAAATGGSATRASSPGTGRPAGGAVRPAPVPAAPVASAAAPVPAASGPASGASGIGDPAAQPAIPGIPPAGVPAGAPASTPARTPAQAPPAAATRGASRAAPAAAVRSAHVSAAAGRAAASPDTRAGGSTAPATASAAAAEETVAVRPLAGPNPARPRPPATPRPSATPRAPATPRALGPARAAAPTRTPAPGRAVTPTRTPAPGRPVTPTRTPAPGRASGPAASPARGPAAAWPRRVTARPASPARRDYQHRMPTAVSNGVTLARVQLSRDEPLYRDVARHRDISWKLLAAVDWMQCKARPGYSAVLGEKLGTVNPDGTIYLTRSEALHQCAEDLADLALAVYQIDLTTRLPLSVGELANVFAAFRWGGLLQAHHTSAMEFPYSVAGLTEQHLNMRWPRIAEPNSPDKPGARFRKPFGAVPLVLGLRYPATV